MPLTAEEQAELSDVDDIDTLSQMLSAVSPDFRRAVMDKGLGLVKTYFHARRLFFGAPHGTEEEDRAFAKVLELIQTLDEFEDICEMFEDNDMILLHRDKLTLLFKKADELGIPKIWKVAEKI